MAYSTFQEIFVFITKDCNLRCSYCSQKHTKWFFISEEVIDDFIDKIFIKIFRNFSRINVYWWEPLLYRDKVLYLIRRISSITLQEKMFFQVEIATNWILFDKSFIDEIEVILRENPYLFISATISIDGNFENNFINRHVPNSVFSALEENIKLWVLRAKEIKNLSVGASVVIPLTYEPIDYIASLKYIFSFWLSKISFILEQDVVLRINPSKDDNLEKKVFQQALNKLWMLERIIDKMSDSVFIEIATLGTEPILSLKPNGDIYNIVCPDFFLLDDIRSHFYVWNIDEINNFEEIQEIATREEYFTQWYEKYDSLIFERLFKWKREYLYNKFLQLKDHLAKNKRSKFDEYKKNMVTETPSLLKT